MINLILTFNSNRLIHLNRLAAKIDKDQKAYLIHIHSNQAFFLLYNTKKGLLKDFIQ